MNVWIDQDLCTGDGLCTDHCPDVFMLLEDGLSYVHVGGHACNDPGGYASAIVVSPVHEPAVVAAAIDCPGECIFVDDEVETVDAVETAETRPPVHFPRAETGRRGVTRIIDV